MSTTGIHVLCKNCKYIILEVENMISIEPKSEISKIPILDFICPECDEPQTTSISTPNFKKLKSIGITLIEDTEQ